MLPERSAELPDVPALGEYGKSEEDKQIFRLYTSGGALGACGRHQRGRVE